MKLMRALYIIICLVPVLAFCLVGCCAAICGFRRIDDFCARQLDDN